MSLILLQSDGGTLSPIVFILLLIVWVGGLVLISLRYLRAQRRFFTLVQASTPLHFLVGDPRHSLLYLQHPAEIPRLLRLFYTHQSNPEIEMARRKTWRIFIEGAAWAILGFVVFVLVAGSKQIA